MCDRAAGFRRRLTVAAMLATAVAPHQARGQSAEQLRTRLLAAARRVDRLKDSLKVLHALRTRELPPDSLAAGELRFRFLRSNLGADVEGALQAAAPRALAIADSVFGDAVHGIAAAAPILATRSRSRFGEFNAADLLTLEIADGGGRSTLVRAPVTQRKIEDGILDLLGTMATARVPARVVGWAGEWVPSRRLTRESWANAAIDLASSNAAIARTCHAGSVPACESALGLTLVRDPLTEWYAPEGWRVLVASWKPPADAYSSIADRTECIERKKNDACERLSRSRPVPIPLDLATRSTLLGLALERGGRTAFSRLSGAAGTPLQILSTVAGMTPDSLIMEWRTRVLAAAPKSTSPSATEATVLVAWTLIFGFAAGRRRP